MAALLTIESQNSDKVALYLAECRELGVPVLPPDINTSALHFTVEPEGVRFGLGAIKGVGEGAVTSLLEARTLAGGRITSVFSLAEQIDLRLVNKKVLESLTKAGAFDSLAPGGREAYRSWRPRIFAGLDRVLDHGGRHQRDRDQGQSGLFASESESEAPLDDAAALSDARAWTETEALGFEKEALGLYMSGHPLQRYASVLAIAGARRVGELSQSEPDVSVGGIVTGLRPLKTKKGDRMAVFSLEDEVAKVEAVVFPEAFGRYGSLVVDDAMLVVRGKYERDEDTSRLVVSEITSLDAVRERVIREVEILLSGRGVGKSMMQSLAAVLDRYPGIRRVAFLVEVNGSEHLRVRTATARRIRPTEQLIKDVEAVCGQGSVRLVS